MVTACIASLMTLDEAYSEVQIATGKLNNDAIRLRKLERPATRSRRTSRTQRDQTGRRRGTLFSAALLLELIP